MAAESNAGAAAPAATVEVRGDLITIDQAAISSWRAFNLFRAIESEESTFAKADAVFALVEMVSGLTAEDIAGRCGGDAADARDVIGYALEVVQAATPKN